MAKRKKDNEVIFLGEYCDNKSTMTNRKRQTNFRENTTSSTFRTASSFPTPTIITIDDDKLQLKSTRDDAAIAKALEDLEKDQLKKNQVENKMSIQLIDAITVAEQLDLHEKLEHDYAVANQIESLNIVHPDLETLDPNPDIYKLFQQFDERFFDGFISTKAVLLKWENLGRDAGRFSWETNGIPRISLSSELMTLRPRRDLVETLLHEMIHAYIHLKRIRDTGAHGPIFKQHMNRINSAAGTNITVCHQFHEEVQYVLKRKAQVLN